MFKRAFAANITQYSPHAFLSGKRISLIIKVLLASVPGLDLTVVDLTEQADAHYFETQAHQDKFSQTLA